MTHYPVVLHILLWKVKKLANDYAIARLACVQCYLVVQVKIKNTSISALVAGRKFLFDDAAWLSELPEVYLGTSQAFKTEPFAKKS